ncbi:MarR family transcriptional regulator [Pseudarthrobacter sp. MEB009]|uniref:MarR family winged helix-turn-helix transcriptional regulator n=1 Tax=Pseudarthrobacter sp. MEB009 TaxID=3040326 RepID=UPI002555152C|nr:MarR family transcriptional regulator [Pseudarthrobacter sp. MEB009]
MLSHEGPPDTPPLHPSAFMLQALLTMANETEREVARHLGLNLTDYRALGAVSQAGPMTVGALAAQLGATAATTTAIVSRLELHGFVERLRSSEDRRQVHVTCTPAAAAAISALMRPLVTATSNHLASLPQDQQAEIGTFLNTVLHLMQHHLLTLSEKDTP